MELRKISFISYGQFIDEKFEIDPAVAVMVGRKEHRLYWAAGSSFRAVRSRWRDLKWKSWDGVWLPVGAR